MKYVSLHICNGNCVSISIEKPMEILRLESQRAKKNELQLYVLLLCVMFVIYRLFADIQQGSIKKK